MARLHPSTQPLGGVTEPPLEVVLALMYSCVTVVEGFVAGVPVLDPGCAPGAVEYSHRSRVSY
jgi:hypothetical protein